MLDKSLVLPSVKQGCNELNNSYIKKLRFNGKHKQSIYNLFFFDNSFLANTRIILCI